MNPENSKPTEKPNFNEFSYDAKRNSYDLDGTPEKRHQDDNGSLPLETLFGLKDALNVPLRQIPDPADFLFQLRDKVGTRILSKKEIFMRLFRGEELETSQAYGYI